MISLCNTSELRLVKSLLIYTLSVIMARSDLLDNDFFSRYLGMMVIMIVIRIMVWTILVLLSLFMGTKMILKVRKMKCLR